MGFKKAISGIKRIIIQDSVTDNILKNIPDRAADDHKEIEKARCQENRAERRDSKLDSDMTQDLMRLVGNAIDNWAGNYGLQNLPKKIVFQQALAILNSMNKLFYSEKQKGD